MIIALVINPGSGRKSRSKTVAKLIETINQDHEIVEYVAQSDSELDDAGRRIRDNYEIVIICGGDGTVSRISRWLIYSKTSILVFPTGSGNDFANHLKMSQELTVIRSVLRNPKTILINTIDLNNGKHTCLTIACFAFEAKVNRIASNLPRPLGKAKYTIATFVALLGKSYEKIEIKSNNLSEMGSYSLAILANSPSFGGGMMISNKAHVLAKDLHLIIVNRVNKIKLIYLFLLLLSGKHYNRREFRQYAVSEIEVKAVDKPIRPQSDGDSITIGDFEAKIQRQSLSVIDCRQ